ncbi:MAG: peptidase [Phenylobacterium sp.]|nr:peptidase [Phenylobacterium sp.]
MTQILARSVLALFATSSLAMGALVAGSASAVAVPSLHATPAVVRGDAEAPQLILAATHHRRHHAATAAVHRKGHHHAAAQAPADEPADAGPAGAAGHLVEVKTPGESYTVKKGDTLEKVADKLGTDIDGLKKLNKIKGSTIRTGQVLKAPASTAKAYVAARGDKLAAVAKRFGVTEKALKAENSLGKRAESLKTGQRLSLPEGYHDHGAPKAEAAAAPGRKSRGRAAAPPLDEAPMASAGGDRSVTGRVTEVAGPPRAYRVRKGDTLDKVADKLGLSVAQLKKDNHLRNNLIRPGQTLKAPGGAVKAYAVGPGDTTFAIAKRFGVSIEALRAANGMGRRGSIHTGEKLRLPPGYRDRGPLTAAAPAPIRMQPQPAAAPIRTQPQAYTPSSTEESPAPGARPPSGPQPYAPPTTPRPYVPQAYSPPVAARPYTPPTTPGAGPALAPQSAPPPTDAQISEMGRGRFQWPLKGEILSDFGPKTPGQRNDGINIRAGSGDAVRAAASGDVVYAGDQVPGFGNLVLVKHADGWVTAYGHLSRVEVKMQQKVSQGQEIGQAGSTGGVAEPQLHFEVRYAPNPLERARPIDPKLVLPR